MPSPARLVLPVALAICGAAPIAHAQTLDQPAAANNQDPEAMRLALEAKRAWAALESMTAKVALTGDGAMGKMSPSATAELLARRADGNWTVRSTGKGRMLMIRKEADFDSIWRPTSTTWIDHEEKTVSTRRNGSGFAHQMADAAKPLGLFGQRPFHAMETTVAISLGDPVEIDGVACDTITFTEPRTAPKGQAGQGEGATYRWSIGREDRLPRRIEQLVDSGTFTGSLTWTLTDLRAGAPLGDSAFTIRTPAGYETIEPPIANHNPNRRIDDGKGDPNRPGSPPPQAAADQKPKPLAVTNAAPDFELNKLGGGTVKLSDLRGKYVLLDFWGTWCAPCKKASPLIQELHEDYADKNFEVLALAFRSQDEQVAKYFEDNRYTYTSLLNAERAVSAYKIRAFPTYVLIGPRGQEIERFVGGQPEPTFSTIRKMLDRFMEEQG